MELIGRISEKQKLDNIMNSDKAEFLAVYGRRRVGKTYLIRQYFNNTFTFYATGLATGNTKQQLTSFGVFLENYFEGSKTNLANWFEAFNELQKQLSKLDVNKKKVIFIDEMPWMDTKRSDFMLGLEYFWNSWASAESNVVLIVCGSAASWIINNLIKNTGGLYNRVTERMKLEPFTLAETEVFLTNKNIVLDRYQTIQLYMVLGGIPYYLDLIKKGKSAMQNIEDICFKNDGKLRSEFSHVFSSLFKNGDKHEHVLRLIYAKGNTTTREELVASKGISSGGNITKILRELEESGFITKSKKYGLKKSNTYYSICDFYTVFYLKFIENADAYEPNIWINKIDNPAFRAWSGYAFEQVCRAHIKCIKVALGIAGVISNNYSWASKGNDTKLGTQIDLVIERRDQVINLFEIKFSINKINISKDYDQKLRTKISSFKTETNTKKAVFLTMLSTHGVLANEYANSAIQNHLTMDDLF